MNKILLFSCFYRAIIGAISWLYFNKIQFYYFVFHSNKIIPHFCFNVIPLLFHIVYSTVRAFTMSWAEILYSMLTEVRVLCYQPSCHNCFHLAVIFIIVIPPTAPLLPQDGSVLRIDDNRLETGSPDIIRVIVGSVVTKILSDPKGWTELNSKRHLITRQTVGCGIPSSLLALRVDLRGLRSKLS